MNSCVLLLTDLLTKHSATQIIFVVIICAYKKCGLLGLPWDLEEHSSKEATPSLLQVRVTG